MPEELVTGAVVYSGRTGEEMLKASDAASKAEYQRTPTTAMEANSTYTDDMSAAGEGEYYQVFSIVHDGDVACDDPVVQGTVYNFLLAYTITHRHVYIYVLSCHKYLLVSFLNIRFMFSLQITIALRT
jgi:hypothetical protein